MKLMDSGATLEYTLDLGLNSPLGISLATPRYNSQTLGATASEVDGFSKLEYTL
jgi:hypothetical protein